ncbi:MAG: hypothetical protein C4K60_15420 [Ideonella sp. MAG2]|nr:MAG: hypothetical protein C4K60_15420 [Ideonella sp. MAG2]
MRLPQDPQKPKLAVELRGIDVFEDALLTLYNRSNSGAVSRCVDESAGVGLLALQQAQALLGLPLPAALRAFYRRLDGGLWLHPAKVLPLAQMMRTSQVLNTTVFDLGKVPSTWTPTDANEALDPRVQSLLWHRDWWPIVEFQGGFLCVDMAPGPEGQAGQIIQVSDPRIPQLATAPRWLASCWLELLAQLHAVWHGQGQGVQEATGPSHGHQLPPLWFMNEPTTGTEELLQAWAHCLEKDALAQTTPDALPAERIEAAVAALHDSERTWLQAQKQALPKAPDAQKLLKAQKLCLIHTLQESPCHSTLWLTDDENDSKKASYLQDWLRGRGVPRMVLLKRWEYGSTSVSAALRRWAAGSAEADLPALLWVDVPVVMLQDPEAVRSLPALVQCELKRRGLPLEAAEVLRAVQQGRCALVLERAEALLHVQPRLWAWLH